MRLPCEISIRVAPDASEPVRYAEEELTRCLERAGMTVQNDWEASALFRIQLREGVPGLEGGSFRCAVTDGGILLDATEGCGIVYGSYDLLEEMGFRFLAPDCEKVPAAPLEIRTGTWEEKPAFKARELFWREAMEGSFAVRLRLNSARSTITPCQGGKLMFYNFSHSFHTLVPAEEWFDTHPEYFSMRNGVRIREKTQLCLSNPEVLALCKAGVRRWIRENPECRIFSVSMNDWYNACECPACRAIDEEEGSQAGSVIRFVNAIAEDIAVDYPEVMLHTFAYLYCRRAPRHVRPADNVIVRLCSIECCFSHPIGRCGRERGGIDVQNGSAANFAGAEPTEGSFLEDLKDWSRICKHLYIWDYTTNYANYLMPFPNLEVLQPNLRLFRDNGVEGVFEQGNFSLGRCSALGQLKIYLLAKLMWDPEEDVDRLIGEFMEGYYGPAAPPMMRYVSLWRDAAEDCHAGIYDMPDADYLNDDILERARELLREAVELAGRGPERDRVEREALTIRYTMLAREDPADSGHGEAVDQFLADAKRLGITELFERKNLDESARALRESRYTRDRKMVSAISYPI